jgi:hypothetical protein
VRQPERERDRQHVGEHHHRERQVVAAQAVEGGGAEIGAEAAEGVVDYDDLIASLRREGRWQELRDQAEAHLREYPGDRDYILALVRELQVYGQTADGAALGAPGAAVMRALGLALLAALLLAALLAVPRRADLRLDMDLQPGDIQFINNYTILHSRTAFVNGPAPHQQRHMLRLWLTFPRPWPPQSSGSPGRPAIRSQPLPGRGRGMSRARPPKVLDLAVAGRDPRLLALARGGGQRAFGTPMLSTGF